MSDVPSSNNKFESYVESPTQVDSVFIIFEEWIPVLTVIFSGLPDSILQKAAAKSLEFEAAYGRHRKGSYRNLAIQNHDEMVIFIQNLVNVTTDFKVELGYFKSSRGIDVSCLTELQGRTRILLQQNWRGWIFCLDISGFLPSTSIFFR